MAFYRGKMRTTVVCFVFAGLAASCFAATNVVIPPERASGDEVGLIFIPGSGIDGLAYRKTVTAIQGASKLRIWAALTGNYSIVTPDPLEVPGAIRQGISALQSSGMKGDNFVGIAHSVGGVYLDWFARKANTPLKAIIMLGTYIGRNKQLKDYPIPVLTLSADLDGLTRITRVAINFEELQRNIQTSPEEVYRTPVLNIKGGNHFQFASGPKTRFIVKRDIVAEITEAQQHAETGEHCDNFLTALFSSSGEDVAKAKDGIKKAYDDGATRFEPLLTLKAMDKNGTYSPWAVEAQTLFAGQHFDHVKINNVLESRLSFIFTRASLTTVGEKVEVNTAAHVRYALNPVDISLVPESPLEIGVKMKSGRAIGNSLGFNGTQETNDVQTCMDLNKIALQLALHVATPESKARYESRGRPMRFEEDVVYYTGIQWVLSGLTLKESGSGLLVQSSALSTPLSSPIVPGMYYCKLLSPYRALEWMVVDSLRNGTQVE